MSMEGNPTTIPADILLRAAAASASASSIPPDTPIRTPILSPSSIIRSPLSALLEYSGILRSNHHYHHHHHHNIQHHQQQQHHIQEEEEDDEAEEEEDRDTVRHTNPATDNNNNNNNNNNGVGGGGGGGGGGGEVSIRIIGPSSSDSDHLFPHHHREQQLHSTTPILPPPDYNANSHSSSNNNSNSNSNANDTATAVGGGGRDSSYQRYDIQHAARWLEQILPFSLLLLLVFIRQHLQGFFVTIWIAAVLFKSNDILRKQTALKGERKMAVLIGISVTFALHVIGVYWWYQNDDLLYPLVMLPPKDIPPFWHAIFIIMVNDILVRQAAMVLKCVLLMYFKNSRGRNYRKQGQMLTLVEYLLLLYRALLPTPVWYRFFLNKEYGSLFSSLMTGLYLTFKLTSVVEKVQSFFAAVKALSRKEVQYGAYATSEQVNAAGDLCAICQEKMHAPVLLRCKHIFCEDCVSEWFERERTCPLCRALVKPADLRSFGDGSTSLFLQFF